MVYLRSVAHAHYKLSTGFSTVRVGIVGPMLLVVNCIYALIYAIYSSQKKSIARRVHISVTRGIL